MNLVYLNRRLTEAANKVACLEAHVKIRDSRVALLQGKAARLEGELRVMRTELVETRNQPRSHSERMGILRDEKAALAAVLDSLETVARSHCRILEGEEPGDDLKDVLAYCNEARAALSGEGKVWEQVEKAMRAMLQQEERRFDSPLGTGCPCGGCHGLRTALAAMKGE